MNKRDLLTLLIVIVLGGTWWFFGNKNEPLPNSSPTFTPIKNNIIRPKYTASSTPIEFTGVELDTSDWLTYQNKNIGISFKYPADWKVEEITNPDFPEYKSILSIHPGNIIVAGQEYYNHVGITCCVLPRDIKNFTDLTEVSNPQTSIQILNINGNKVVIKNYNEDGITATVSIYVISGNKIFNFDVMQPDVYNEKAYKIAVGIIRNFSASQ